MKRYIIFSLFCLFYSFVAIAQYDTLWVRHDNRFESNGFRNLSEVDTIEFRTNSMRFIMKPDATKSLSRIALSEDERYMFTNPGRILYQPTTWSNNDYTKSTSQWSFSRSMESDHYVVFWEKGFGDDPTTAGSYAFDPQEMLDNGEIYFDIYADTLGFIEPGNSTTDKYKIQMYVYYTTDWKAEGSGYDHKTGSFNVSPSAISSRNGQTVAHEIGHTFQYLVKCDLGDPHGFDYGFGEDASGGNGWWESCANWQAYKVYPQYQFEQDFYSAYKSQYHLGIMHEDFRYQNMFIQDWWCAIWGQNYIGKLWREAEEPEDPIEATIRLNNLSITDFNDLMYNGFAHMATWDIDGIREYGRSHIGEYSASLHEAEDDNQWWEVDSTYCPQNYGYNMIPLKLSPSGTIVTAQFKGTAGAKGYRAINTDKAGWRYGFVAYTSEEETFYSDMGYTDEGEISISIPDNCTNLWFTVVGTPTEYWRHPWDDDYTNDEQWPYRVAFNGTSPSGFFHTYDEYDEDYERRDTTVVYYVNLAYSSSSYSYTTVTYDMDAISQALGLSTEQMKAIKVGKSNTVRFVGVSKTGSLTESNTTTTASSTRYGHWFNTSGNVCDYGSVSAIYAEMLPESYLCYVGQYPGRLVTGKTYTIRQAIIYTHTDGNEYTATMEVHITIL